MRFWAFSVSLSIWHGREATLSCRIALGRCQYAFGHLFRYATWYLSGKAYGESCYFWAQQVKMVTQSVESNFFGARQSYCLLQQFWAVPSRRPGFQTISSSAHSAIWFPALLRELVVLFRFESPFHRVTAHLVNPLYDQ